LTAARSRQVYAHCDRELTPWLIRRVPDAQAPDKRRIFFPAWIVRAPEWQALEPADHAVLLAIMGHTDQKGRGQVAYSELALETGRAESTVISGVARLEKAGWLKVTRERISASRNATNVYQLVYPGEADQIRRAVERAAKEGAGSRADPRVRPEDVYCSNGAWKVRKAFLHVWEFASAEWQSLMRSPWALDCLLVLRSRAIAGTVALSKLAIAQIVGRVAGDGGKKRAKARGRTRVWEATKAMVKLGVLTVVKRGGSSPKHRANLYAPCVPPSCAQWSEFWSGSAPGAVEEVKATAEIAPAVLRFPGVRVAFVAGSTGDGACLDCSRPSKVPRRYLHKPSSDVWSWEPRYCSGAHEEPVIAECPECQAPLADAAAMEVCRAAWARGEDGSKVLTVDAAEGDVTCGKCSANHRFAEAWIPDQRAPESSAPWTPMDADRLVRVWLDGRRETRVPVASEIAVAARVIVETGDWWKARIRILAEWKRHDSKDVRYLTGLAQRAGFVDSS
jgi:hypothetical protein